jgi:hypothetical protein
MATHSAFLLVASVFLVQSSFGFEPQPEVTEAAATLPTLPGMPRKRLLGRDRIAIMMGTNYPPYAMWNTTGGKPDQLGGIGYDFALEACRQCNLDCIMTVDKWANCWDNDLPGIGLMSGYYHSCATFTNQYQRQWSLEFSEAFLAKNKPAGILSKLDLTGQPVIPPSSDLSGFKICDVAGWAPTIKTLSYSKNDCAGGTLFQGFKVVTPAENGPDAAMKALLVGDCDAVYMYADMVESRRECLQDSCSWDVDLYTRLGTDYAWIHTGVMEHMANGTTLTMSKKGSGVADIINPCIRRALQTKAYYEMCEKHGVTKECYPNQYFPPGATEKEAFAMSNSERQEHCMAATESDQIHAECGCNTGYCGCQAR